MADKPPDEVLNSFGSDRIGSRQIDELIGLARGIAADGVVTVEEAEFLQKWLAANATITDQPLIRDLYRHVTAVLSDHVIDADECRDLVGTLNALSTRDFELGEPLKATTLPLSKPPPALVFSGQDYCFTGTFMFGRRKQCEGAVTDRGGRCGSLTHKTDVLVIGTYATESWKHSSFGLKIMRACEWRDHGLPIAIVSEAHWTAFL